MTVRGTGRTVTLAVWVTTLVAVLVAPITTVLVECAWAVVVAVALLVTGAGVAVTLIVDVLFEPAGDD